MIHMSQVKVPVRELVRCAPANLVRKGIVGEEERDLVRRAAAGLLKISPDGIRDLEIVRKSVDARKRQEPAVIYQVEFRAEQEQRLLKRYGKSDGRWLPEDGNSPVRKRGIAPGGCAPALSGGSAPAKRDRLAEGKGECPPMVVGFGPAGMFAALTLARAGLAPLVIERGRQVEQRQQAVERFWKTGVLDPECNVQFGEGGAGTFSDGKLNTQVKDRQGRNRRVLETFAQFGAPGEILYLQKPHIGTDVLRDVVKNIREEIIRLGGSFSFGVKLADVEVQDGGLASAVLEEGGRRRVHSCRQMVLATGHSARDTFYALYGRGLRMEAKPFAVGVRVEHPQEMIGESQYGPYVSALPPADYKLTWQARNGRGVYTFCMCPGGYVVNASSEEGRLAVNGMSYYDRAGTNANSAVIVTLTPEDYGGEGPLSGIAFQRKYEELAYRQAEGRIPVQLLGDFLRGEKSTGFGAILPAMKGEYALGNVREILPIAVGDAIAEGMSAFGGRIRGFDREDTILSGIESRTSSPVRIVRDASLQGSIPGIYPCGEGAGYAGGITSAAADGIRVAEMILGREDERDG